MPKHREKLAQISSISQNDIVNNILPDAYPVIIDTDKLKNLKTFTEQRVYRHTVSCLYQEHEGINQAVWYEMHAEAWNSSYLRHRGQRNCWLDLWQPVSIHAFPHANERHI